MEPSYVYYCCFGSNLDRQRFLKYIEGGAVPGSNRVEVGSTNKAHPLEERPFKIPRALYFAKQSQSWTGSVAFLDYESEVSQDEEYTLGKIYLITEEQFLDVVKQENSNFNISDVEFRRVCEESKQKKHGHLLPGVSGWYSRIVYLGDESAQTLEGSPSVPVFTFTSPQSFAHEQGPPSPSYARTIARGIKQTYTEITDEQIAIYLATRKGPHGRVTKQDIEKWLKTS